MGDLYSKLERFMSRFFEHINNANVHLTLYELETHQHDAGSTNPVVFDTLRHSTSDTTLHDAYTDPPHCSGTHVGSWNVVTHGPFYLEGQPSTNAEVYGWPVGVNATLTSAYVNARYPVGTTVTFDVLVTNVEQSRSIELATSATYQKTTITSITVTSAQVVGVRMTKGLSTFVMGAGFHVVLRGKINYP